MSCCGSRRASLRSGGPVSAPSFASDSVLAASARGGSAAFRPSSSRLFEYTGHAQLAVTGPLTGVVYRFSAHGQRVQVHGADAASLISIPLLKAVR
jgi:hypothetical protein